MENVAAEFIRLVLFHERLLPTMLEDVGHLEAHHHVNEPGRDHSDQQKAVEFLFLQQHGGDDHAAEIARAIAAQENGQRAAADRERRRWP